jgi:hypothetical protein
MISCHWLIRTHVMTGSVSRVKPPLWLACGSPAGAATDTLAQVLVAASKQGLHQQVVKATMVALVTAGKDSGRLAFLTSQCSCTEHPRSRLHPALCVGSELLQFPMVKADVSQE